MDKEFTVSLPLKHFLLIETCPEEWLRLDLYLLRDESAVFYVGQSDTAFRRIWNHFYAGFKGRSVMGRFIVCNWPVSMRFTIEMLSSRSARFDCVQNDLDRSEQLLIRQYNPCLNTTYNSTPAPIPAQYASPFTPLKFRHHAQKCLLQAAQAVEAEKLRAWLDETGR